jgi:CRISPR-associated exonuclease Cas4
LNEFNDNKDYLLISGIQHFMYCERQWGLIHIENAWSENVLTIEGTQVHERVDDPEIFESRGETFYSRSVPVVSNKLNIQGVIDIIEFQKNKNGVFISSKSDYYMPNIIEYKHGSPKMEDYDTVQLCAQAMAFEEMKNCILDFGFIFYNQTKRREKIFFTTELREKVVMLIKQMNEYYFKQVTPLPVNLKKCKNCSLNNLCAYNIKNMSAEDYIKKTLKEI